MELNLDDFQIRRTKPVIAGSEGLPKGHQRYICKALGLIGVDFDKGDRIILKNLEGDQICEITVFNSKGLNNQSIINKKKDIENSYLKKILDTSDDKIFLRQKLKNKNIELNSFYFKYCY